MQEDIYCAEASLSVGEPLHGTAVAETDAWIVLEQAEPWGPKGLEDSALPTSVVEHLSALGRAFPRLRVQLVRRPDREAPTPALFLARGSQGREELAELPIPDHASVAELPLAEWLGGGALPAGARPLGEPLYLVCVHGRRDRCCARRGMPVYSALRALAGDRVWQTTHLGGHRFAATLAVLPHGICYGRVEPSEATALVEAHRRGELFELGRMRGRTALAQPAQAAEILLREQLAERRIDALRFLRSEPVPGGQRVTFVHLEGGEHALEVAHAPLAPAPASCGASPKAGQALVPLVRRAP